MADVLAGKYVFTPDFYNFQANDFDFMPHDDGRSQLKSGRDAIIMCFYCENRFNRSFGPVLFLFSGELPNSNPGVVDLIEG